MYVVYLTIKYVSVFTTQKAVPQSKTSYSNIIKYMPNTTCEKSVHAQAHHQMSNVTDTEKSGNKDHIFKASGMQTTVAVSVATWRRHSSTCCALGEMPVNLGFYTQPTTRCCSFRYATLFTFLSTLFPGAPREKAPLKQRGKSRRSTLSNLANRAPRGGTAEGGRPGARRAQQTRR